MRCLVLAPQPGRAAHAAGIAVHVLEDGRRARRRRTHRRQGAPATSAYSGSMLDSPPPSTMASGSSTLMTHGERRGQGGRTSAAIVARATRRRRLAGDGTRHLCIRRSPASRGRRRGRGRQESLHAAVLAAIAGGPGPFVVARPGQGIVSPLAGDAMRAGEHAAVDDHAAADPGAQDHAEHDAFAPLPAPSAASDSAKQLASLASAHLAVQRAPDRGPAACRSARWSWRS